MMNTDTVKAAIAALKAEDAAAALALLEEMLVAAASGEAEAAPDPAAESAAEDPVSENPEDKEPEAAALSATLVALSGKKTAGEAASFFAELVKNVKATEARQAVLDASERRGLIVRLIKLGAETPHTAFAGEPKECKPCARLNSESVESMRARVESLEASRPAGFEAPEAPRGEAPITLTQAEQAYCAKHNMTPEQFVTKRNGAIRKAQ